MMKKCKSSQLINLKPSSFIPHVLKNARLAQNIDDVLGEISIYERNIPIQLLYVYYALQDRKQYKSEYVLTAEEKDVLTRVDKLIKKEERAIKKKEKQTTPTD